MKILVINGPNMNLLGKREKKFYGSSSLIDLENAIRKEAQKTGIVVDFFQTNYEGAIIEKVQKAENEFNGVILNPAGFTHTSIAIRDAISAVDIPVIEVHITNIFAREDFRSKTITGGTSRGVISGLGINSYILALHWFLLNE